MEEAPQKRRGPPWAETVAPEDRSILHNMVVAFAFALVRVVPAAIWPDRGFMDYGGNGWAFWPAFLLLVVLSACLLDDHLERSPRDRVIAVLYQMGCFLVSSAVIARFTHVHHDPIQAQVSDQTIATFGWLFFGLNSSRTMVKWAHRSQRIRYDRFGEPYLQ